MGHRDDVRRMRELKQANPGLSYKEIQPLLELEKRQARATQFADHFAPTAVEPYIEVVPYSVFKVDLDAFVRSYLGIVGLQPEDVFAIYQESGHNAGMGPLSIVYRDRPEYAEGRHRYRRIVLGE